MTSDIQKNRIVTTRLTLRQDSVDHWLSSELKLYSGEPAISYEFSRFDGTKSIYRLKIGKKENGELLTWKDLPYLNVDVSDVIGLSNYLSGTINTHYKLSSIDNITLHLMYSNDQEEPYAWHDTGDVFTVSALTSVIYDLSNNLKDNYWKKTETSSASELSNKFNILSSFSNEWKSSVDLSIAGLSSYSKYLEDNKVNIVKDHQDNIAKFTSDGQLTSTEKKISDIVLKDDVIENPDDSASPVLSKGIKNFVNSSINAFAAFYITKDISGNPFNTYAELTTQVSGYNAGKPRVPTKNDYTIVLEDEKHTTSLSVNPTTRYTFLGTYLSGGAWLFLYIVNNTSLTQAQVDAINSTITLAKVQLIQQNKTDILNISSSLTSDYLKKTHCYETSDITLLSSYSEYVNGDIAIEKKQMSSSLTSLWCAYRWSKFGNENWSWKALDGNYSAENVYFKEDILLAGDYTQVGNIKITDSKLSSAGKSVKTLFEQIFDKTIMPLYGDSPSCLITLNSAGIKEAGENFTPSWKVTYSQGKYLQPWHVDLSGNVIQVNDGTLPITYSIKDSLSRTSTLSSGSFAAFIVTDNTSYDISAYVSYSVGQPAKNNKGDDTSIQRSAGLTLLCKSSNVTSYRKPFWGYKLYSDSQLDFTRLNSNDIRNLPVGGKGSSGSSTEGFPSKFIVPIGSKQIVFSAKAGAKNDLVAKDANALNAPVTFKKHSKLVYVNGYNSYSAVEYDVWECTLDSYIGALKEMDLRLTWT